MLSDAFAGLQKLMLPDRWQALAMQALRAGHDVVVDAPGGRAGERHVCGVARAGLREARADALPELPPLTADQRCVINHGVLRPPRVAPPGRLMAGQGR